MKKNNQNYFNFTLLLTVNNPLIKKVICIFVLKKKIIFKIGVGLGLSICKKLSGYLGPKEEVNFPFLKIFLNFKKRYKLNQVRVKVRHLVC
jgi:hypothetical protein